MILDPSMLRSVAVEEGGESHRSSGGKTVPCGMLRVSLQIVDEEFGLFGSVFDYEPPTCLKEDMCLSSQSSAQ
jgi:hypothetical protein